MTCRRPSEISTMPLQNRRGMVCAAHGRNAVSRIFSKLTIRRSVVQYMFSFSLKREAVVARRQLALVFRAGQVEIHLQPIGGAGRCRRKRGECRSKPKSEQ